MKILIISTATLLLLFSCNSNWNPEIIKKECMDGVKKSEMDTSNPENLKMAEALCDCSAQKIVLKYRSQTDAEADKKGLETITMDCMKEFYQNAVKK